MADFWNSIARFFGYEEWQWGTAADWVGAIGTAGALLLGLLLLAREITTNRRKDADNLVAWSNMGTVTAGERERWGRLVHATNTGTRPIGAPAVTYKNKLGRYQTKFLTPSGDPDMIHPGETVMTALSENIARASPIYLAIRDPSGRLWVRYVTAHVYPRGVRRLIAMTRILRSQPTIE